MSVRNSAVRKNICDLRCHDITQQVLKIESELRSHQIGNVKTAHSQNNGEHAFFCPDLLPRPLWRLFSMDAQLRGMLTLKNEPALVTYDTGAEFVHRHTI
jgi:hypothetical protein